MLRFAFFVLAGLAVFVSIFGMPDTAKTMWNEFQKKRAMQAAQERAIEIENAFASWYRAPTDCATTRSEIRKLECKNIRDMEYRAFIARQKH